MSIKTELKPCSNCPFHYLDYAQGGWCFIRCKHDGEFKGKYVGEIEKCPMSMEEKKIVLAEIDKIKKAQNYLLFDFEGGIDIGESEADDGT